MLTTLVGFGDELGRPARSCSDLNLFSLQAGPKEILLMTSLIGLKKSGAKTTWPSLKLWKATGGNLLILRKRTTKEMRRSLCRMTNHECGLGKKWAWLRLTVVFKGLTVP